MVSALNSILLSSSTRPVASQLSFSNTVEVSVGIPELADVSRSDTISVSLTNTIGKMYHFLFCFQSRYKHILKVFYNNDQPDYSRHHHLRSAGKNLHIDRKMMQFYLVDPR